MPAGRTGPADPAPGPGAQTSPAPAGPAPAGADASLAAVSGGAAVSAPGAPAPGATVAAVAAPGVVPAHEQVLQVITPLRTGPDGTYSLTLQLEPQGLGRVVAHLEVAAGQVSVHLTAETAAGHSALSAGMNRLAQSLSRPGSPANVQLRSGAGGGGAPGHGGSGAAPDRRAASLAASHTAATDVLSDPDPVSLGPAEPDRLVDVQL